MFSKIKTWLRAIISEEVAKISVSLKQEREEAIATIKNAENEVARSFAKEVETFKATVETLHDEFATRLKATREHIGNGSPSRCVASAEQVAADHKLRKSK